MMTFQKKYTNLKKTTVIFFICFVAVFFFVAMAQEPEQKSFLPVPLSKIIENQGKDTGASLRIVNSLGLKKGWEAERLKQYESLIKMLQDGKEGKGKQLFVIEFIGNDDVRRRYGLIAFFHGRSVKKMDLKNTNTFCLSEQKWTTLAALADVATKSCGVLSVDYTSPCLVVVSMFENGAWSHGACFDPWLYGLAPSKEENPNYVSSMTYNFIFFLLKDEIQKTRFRGIYEEMEGAMIGIDAYDLLSEAKNFPGGYRGALKKLFPNKVISSE